LGVLGNPSGSLEISTASKLVGNPAQQVPSAAKVMKSLATIRPAAFRTGAPSASRTYGASPSGPIAMK